MIDKKLFVSCIEKLREQHLLDQHNSSVISEVFGEGVSAYNNNALYVVVLDLLKVYFPADKEGFCEIEHYCFEKDFGKVGDEYESPEELYDRLSGKIIKNSIKYLSSKVNTRGKFRKPYSYLNKGDISNKEKQNSISEIEVNEPQEIKSFPFMFKKEGFVSECADEENEFSCFEREFKKIAKFYNQNLFEIDPLKRPISWNNTSSENYGSKKLDIDLLEEVGKWPKPCSLPSAEEYFTEILCGIDFGTMGSGEKQKSKISDYPY